MFKFKASDLPEILTRWSARYSVFVPSGSPDNAQMRIWSRRTRKEVRFMEPDEYTNLIVAPKGFVFGEREELFRWEGNEKTCTAISAPSSSSLQEEDKILFGLRPCDTYGLAYMDRFFLGEHHDILTSNVFAQSQALAFGRTEAEVAAALGVTARTVRKWQARYAAEGEPGLRDRSSRPHVSPRRLDEAAEAEILALRRQPGQLPVLQLLERHQRRRDRHGRRGGGSRQSGRG